MLSPLSPPIANILIKSCSPTTDSWALIFENEQQDLSSVTRTKIEIRGKRRKEWEVSFYLLRISYVLIKSPVE